MPRAVPRYTRAMMPRAARQWRASRSDDADAQCYVEGTASRAQEHAALNARQRYVDKRGGCRQRYRCVSNDSTRNSGKTGRVFVIWQRLRASAMLPRRASRVHDMPRYRRVPAPRALADAARRPP